MSICELLLIFGMIYFVLLAGCTIFAAGNHSADGGAVPVIFCVAFAAQSCFLYSVFI